MSDIGLIEIERAISHQFREPKLLIEALTHKSHFNEQRAHYFNERLEFLGDSVLNLVVSEILMQKLPSANEGLLSKVRSQLVNENYLAEVARTMKLGDYINLGKGEEKGGGRFRNSLLADALEAVIGALYLDAGLSKVRSLIEGNFLHFKDSDGFDWKNVSQGLANKDYKSRFQEFCQQANLGTPRYDCILAEGANPSEGPFTMILMLQDREIDRSTSLSKKAATQDLAHRMLSMESATLIDFLKSKGLEFKLNKTVNMNSGTNSSVGKENHESSIG